MTKKCFAVQFREKDRIVKLAWRHEKVMFTFCMSVKMLT